MSLAAAIFDPSFPLTVKRIRRMSCIFLKCASASWAGQLPGQKMRDAGLAWIFLNCSKFNTVWEIGVRVYFEGKLSPARLLITIDPGRPFVIICTDRLEEELRIS
jgi:hypothetical protein